jgi:TonB family protein
LNLLADLQGTGSGGGGAAEETIGVGGLGTIGRGNGSGYGRGAAGSVGRRVKAPDVLQGNIELRGALDKAIVRRIVQRHINEVKYCYEQGLSRRPGLRGRVQVQFTIAASGQVIASVLQDSTIGNARVENCVVSAIQRWEFPKPNGSSLVIVSYPFTFVPGAVGGEESGPNASPRGADRHGRETLAALAAAGSVDDRVRRVAERLALPSVRDPEALAWTIDRAGATLNEILLVARLLEIARREQDAIRVLSERAAAVPDAIAQELRRMGAASDAAEVRALTKRHD